MPTRSLPLAVLALALVACRPSAAPSPAPEPAPPAAPAPAPAAVARVELFPDAALLRAAGEEVALTVRAYDAGGRLLEGRAVTWHSSHADVVAVDAGGRARAQAELGSARLVAEVEGVRSNVALVVVAQVRPEVTLVTDAQVRTPPLPLPAPEDAPEAPPRWEAVLQGLPAPAPGQLLLAQGATPLIGRVLSAEAEGDAVRVRLELPALPEVFTRLRLDEQVELEGTGDTATAQGGARGGLQGLDVPPPPPGIPDYEFMLGPLKCKAAAEVVPIDSPLSFKYEQKVAFDVKADVAEGDLRHLRLVAKGRATLTPVGGLTLQLKGKASVSCEKELLALKVPMPGWVSLAFIPSVPFGVGFGLEGAFTAKTWQFILEGKHVRDFTVGVDFTPATGMVGIAETQDTSKITPRMVLTPEDGAKDLDVELSAQVYGYTGVNALVGLGLKKFGLLKAVAGPKLELKWEPEDHQAARVDYAAVLDLKWQVKWGLAGDTKDFLTLLRGITGPYVGLESKTDVVLARTPVGVLSVDRARLQEEEPVRLTVRYTPETARFLGVYNIEQVRLYRVGKAEDGSTLLEEVPGLEPLVPSGEQTEFSWEWRPPRGSLGQHTFVAFTRTALPLLTFEVADNSRTTLVVDQKCSSGSGFPLCIESGPYVGASGGVRVTPQGVVAGFVYEGELMRAATWDWALGHTQLGLLSTRQYAQSASQGVSPSGALVTGWADSVEPSNGGLIPEAFLWRDGQLVGLGTRARYGAASQSHGAGVRDDGTVAGQVLQHLNGVWSAYAWVWKDGVLTDLGSIGASSSLGTGTVSGFDAAGNVVGTRVIELAPGVHLAEPTVWTRAASGAWTPRSLPHLGYGAVLSGGNGRGPWVGSVHTSQTSHVAVRWSDTSFRTLGSLGGPSHATAANTRGDVVGYSFTDAARTQRRAVLVRADTGAMVDLNTLVNPALGWVLESASDINDEGVIVGQGRQNGQLRMFRLVPAPGS